ncbi:MAG TPA: site-specific integrase [Bryobacteraceae bacterium]|nr:site-specific integrase [Bryobacteraceae bacterium]
MLSVYTRHSAGCARKDDIHWKRCRCPKWINGLLNGQFIRKSAKTRSWERAEDTKRQWEVADNPHKHEPARIDDAIDSYLTDAKARELKPATLYKLEGIFRKQFLSWTQQKGLRYLKEVNVPLLREFRGTWQDAPLAKKKKQERLIGFFWFCVRSGWLTGNPTTGLGRIIVDQTPTDYFTREEFDKIIDATYVYRENRWEQGDRNSTRLRILTLLMRWSGLRIRDAITLEKSRLTGDSVLLYQAKTKTPVYVPLPPHVADALRTMPSGIRANPRYFFWTGNGLPKSAVADWQRSYRRLFNIVNLRRPDGTAKRCFPHMFRDTFAVEMLLAGVPLEQVSILLGHKSVKITEKHYAPWVKARQEQLEQNVRKAWAGNLTTIESAKKEAKVPRVAVAS